MVQVRDTGMKSEDIDVIAEKSVELARGIGALIQGGDASIAAGVMLFLGERYLHAMVEHETDDQKEKINAQVTLVMTLLQSRLIPVASKVSGS
jgi:hypothetical protein